MINPGSMAAGVAINMAAEKASEFADHVIKEEPIAHPTEWQLLEQIRDFTRLTAEALNTELTKNLDIAAQIQPYPGGFTLPSHSRKHVSMFIPSLFTGTGASITPALTTVKMLFEIPGAGTHVKTMTIGWNQLDLPHGTIISTADGNNYAVIISLRDDPIGVAI